MTRREHFSTQVSADTQARVRATVRGMAQNAANGYTLAQFADDALAAYCRHLEELYHHGKPWPRSATRLQPGPRI